MNLKTGVRRLGRSFLNLPKYQNYQNNTKDEKYKIDEDFKNLDIKIKYNNPDADFIAFVFLLFITFVLGFNLGILYAR